MNKHRVVSGMRPTGKLHLGHYHGVLANWRQLQNEYQCQYFIADWHALTTHYDNRHMLSDNTLHVLIDWLVCGIDPQKAVLFQQSHIAQHAELHLILSMITPLGWLERVPTYKDQIAKLRHLDLSTYGFLGYPVLQSADILVYGAQYVPVGADQVAHIEMAREIARRFNYIFGRNPEFDQQVEQALAGLTTSLRKAARRARKLYGERGESRSVEKVMAQVECSELSDVHKASLHAWMENRGLKLLVEPQALVLSERAKLPGLDGQKMSKSYGNAIYIRDDDDRINTQIRHMPTDPARVRRDDPGNPEKCPVWNFHLLYTDDKERQRLDSGCRSGTTGCLECKGVLSDRLIADNRRFNDRAKPFLHDKAQLLDILKQGNEQAADVCSQTMQVIRQAIGFLELDTRQ